ncbi:MAG: exodeoxyribonuclease VII small subunit [Bacteroidaceae bacterium]|mgnify:FL=1|jgi:exodeoxyribonuclease VII small subunit|nr:exodeoxyribonuclease VII small subunit [Bacteroidaceae bacterium]MBQ5573892.1 exodeoxyribonuclease VII small subunit [Bacteroidaceae bacterium]
MKYEEAMKRLEQIVSDIENNKLDIDLISDKIKEAQELIKFCKDKLYKTDEEIQKLLED